jgi:hypothetical protein
VDSRLGFNNLIQFDEKIHNFYWYVQFYGKIYPILVPFSIFPLKCMVKNNFKKVFGNTCCWWSKDYNYAISFRTMSKLHFSSTVSLDFIIVGQTFFENVLKYLKVHTSDQISWRYLQWLFQNLLNSSKVMINWSSENDHIYFIMVAILNFICLYQEIEYQKLFENNNEI